MKDNIFNIAICDDDLGILKKLKLDIESYDFENIKINIALFKNSKPLLKEIEDVDILFLDVEMPGMNGFETAERIIKLKKDTIVVFVSNHMELVQEAFKVKAFRYLYKPYKTEEIKEVLDEAFKELLSNDIVIAKIKDREIYIKAREIYLIEALGDNSAIYLSDSHIITCQTLKHWKEILGDSFFQSHKSYIVNFLNVKEICYGKESMIEMVDGKLVQVSIRNRSLLKKEYHNFIKKNAKYM